MIKKLKLKLGLVVCLLLFSSCSLFARNTIPYLVEAEMVLEESTEYEIAGLNFDFYNREEKNIKNFTLVFYLFDYDGNPVSLGKSNIVLTVNTEVGCGERIQGCISLDKFLFEYPEEPYQVDYLYVSKIEYEDESIWSDPYGLLAF